MGCENIFYLLAFNKEESHLAGYGIPALCRKSVLYSLDNRKRKNAPFFSATISFKTENKVNTISCFVVPGDSSRARLILYDSL